MIRNCPLKIEGDPDPRGWSRTGTAVSGREGCVCRVRAPDRTIVAKVYGGGEEVLEPNWLGHSFSPTHQPSSTEEFVRVMAESTLQPRRLPPGGSDDRT